LHDDDNDDDDAGQGIASAVANVSDWKPLL